MAWITKAVYDFPENERKFWLDKIKKENLSS